MAFQVYLKNTVVVIHDTVIVKKDETLNPALIRYWVKQDGQFFIQESTEKTIYNLGTFDNIQDENGSTFGTESALRDYFSTFINATPAGTAPTPINPLMVSQDEITVDDIDWEASDFTDWVGNPKDLFGNVNNGGIYNETANNPKVFILRLIRTKKMRDFGIGTSIGSFSNLKAILLGSADSERGILDISPEPHKDASWVYSQEEFVFNAVRVEFHTSDRVDVSNLFFKYSYSNKKQDYVNKWGLLDDIDTGASETVWTIGDQYIFTETPQPYFFSSSSAADINKPIRMELIVVNASGRLQRVIVDGVLNGQNKIAIAGLTCVASNRAFTIIPIPLDPLDGDVYIYEDTTLTGGVPDDLSKVRTVIPSDLGQSAQAVYTVPEFLEDGRLIISAEIYNWYARAIRSRTTAGIATLFVAENGFTKRARAIDGLSESDISGNNYTDITPESVNPGADIWVQASEITSNDVSIAAGFTIKLIAL